jgi:hypothetical protein
MSSLRVDHRLSPLDYSRYVDPVPFRVNDPLTLNIDTDDGNYLDHDIHACCGFFRRCVGPCGLGFTSILIYPSLPCHIGAYYLPLYYQILGASATKAGVQ